MKDKNNKTVKLGDTLRTPRGQYFDVAEVQDDVQTLLFAGNVRSWWVTERYIQKCVIVK